jgi:hypothetical protein
MSAPGIERSISNAQPQHGYDLPAEAAQQLASELLNERPPTGDARFVCYKLEGTDPSSNIGRQVEGVVFNQTFHNDPEEMVREYGSYEEQSIFFTSVDRENEKPTSGALRVIENGPAGFKTINDLAAIHGVPVEEYQRKLAEHHGIEDWDKCWDVGTVAVLPEYRSAEGGISIQLYRALYVAAMEQGIEHFISVIDSKPLTKLTDYLGIPFVPLADSGPMEYLGSKRSQAVYGHVPEFYRKMNRARLFTVRGWLARKALKLLVAGSGDDALQFDSVYKKQ